MRTTPALAGLLAILALPGAAQAATLGTIPVDPNRQVQGHFDAPGTQTWRVYLRQGRYYAVYGRSDPELKVQVRAAGGGLVGAFEMWDDNAAEGASFRA